MDQSGRNVTLHLMQEPERVWKRPDSNSEMQFAELSSSRGRHWTGIEAAVYETSGGRVERSPSAHNISMHVGPAVRAYCRFDSPAQLRIQQPGDIDVVPMGCTAIWEDAGPATILSVNLSQALVRSVADEAGLNAELVRIMPQMQLRDPKLQHIGWAIKEELETADPLDRVYADGLGVALATHLLRRYSSAVPSGRRGLTTRQRKHVLDFIDENLERNLSLDELAGEAGVSASYLKVLFRESVGLPVHQYIIKRRVEYAAMLLTRGNLSPSQIAVQAGFCDQGHMARCMRRVLGLVPSELLRICQ